MADTAVAPRRPKLWEVEKNLLGACSASWEFVGERFSHFLSPYRFHPFDDLNPIMNGQGRGWITTMDYSTSHIQQGGSGCMWRSECERTRTTKTIYCRDRRARRAVKVSQQIGGCHMVVHHGCVWILSPLPRSTHHSTPALPPVRLISTSSTHTMLV